MIQQAQYKKNNWKGIICDAKMHEFLRSVLPMGHKTVNSKKNVRKTLFKIVNDSAYLTALKCVVNGICK